MTQAHLALNMEVLRVLNYNQLVCVCVCVCGGGGGGGVCVPFSTFESWHKFQKCPETPKRLQISSGTGPEGVRGFL